METTYVYDHELWKRLMSMIMIMDNCVFVSVLLNFCFVFMFGVPISVVCHHLSSIFLLLVVYFCYSSCISATRRVFLLLVVTIRPVAATSCLLFVAFVCCICVCRCCDVVCNLKGIEGCAIVVAMCALVYVLPVVAHQTYSPFQIGIISDAV